MATVERVELPASVAQTRNLLLDALGREDHESVDALLDAFETAAHAAVQQSDRRALAGLDATAARLARVLVRHGDDGQQTAVRVQRLQTAGRFLESAYLAAVAAEAPEAHLDVPAQFRARRKPTVRARVLEFVVEHPGARPADVVQALGLERQQVNRALRELKDQERVHPVSAGQDDGRAVAYAAA